jgi:serine kinase of HPr protein (carbohydrate metabolism regulator)
MGFFLLTGIPGCAKSALCKELLNAQGGLLGDDRPVHSLMGDLIKGKICPNIVKNGISLIENVP